MRKIGTARLEKVAPRCNRNLSDYDQFISSSLKKEIEQYAAKVKGTRVLTINATPWGGGVAEILHSMVPLMNSVGIEVEWDFIKTNYAPFFEITKSIHNQFQGEQSKLTQHQKYIYRNINEDIAKAIVAKKDNFDLFWVHDPQPVASWPMANDMVSGDIGPAAWRCHIDTSNPSKDTWAFLKPYIKRYENKIFTMKQYAGKDIQQFPISVFTPTIDPLDTKILPVAKDKSQKLLQKFGIDTTRPIVTQISRFDIWKDPWGVIDAYRKAKREIKDLVLVLVGPLALDDPEAMDVHTKLLKYVEGISSHEDIQIERDIFILTNQDGFLFKELDALYTAADIVVQKSLVEGFGLVVTEANWKEKPVIGGDTGGIRHQIKDYRHHKQDGTGILVNVSKEDNGVEETAQWIIKFLQDKKLMRRLGKNAQKRVKENFLHPHALLNYLKLFDKMKNSNER